MRTVISWTVTTFILVGSSALLGSGILFRHRRIMTFLAVAGVLAQAQWLVLVALSRVLLPGFESGIVHVLGSLLFLIIWLVLCRTWRFPHHLPTESGYRDLLVLFVTGGVLLSSWLIVSRNGFIGDMWISHGFYNGDTATLAALVNRSFTTIGLLHDNPFAAGATLEYPTLLHAGIADFFATLGIGTEWLYFLPIATLSQILITIPLLFLLFDTVFVEPIGAAFAWFGIRKPAVVHVVATVVIGWVLMLSWDTYVYPQSHFFLTGIFLLVIALLFRGYQTFGRQQAVLLVPATCIVAILILSNAIYGTAVMALLAVFGACRLLDRKRPVAERATYSILTLAVVLFFLLWTPGNGAFGRVKFSYTAAADMVVLTPALALLIPALLRALTKHRFIVASVASLCGLAFLSFFFSTRNIVVANAPRFFYGALLVSFPVLISFLIQLYYWVKRELIDTSHVLTEQLAGWGLVGTAVLLFFFPGLASVVSAHDHLMRSDEHVVSSSLHKALLVIELSTSPDAVFIASPNEPFLVPLFTGRSVLRTDYWLSPDDMVLADLKAAFAGDKAAQEQVLSRGDYLFLTAADRAVWEPLQLPVLFNAPDAVIYKLH